MCFGLRAANNAIPATAQAATPPHCFQLFVLVIFFKPSAASSLKPLTAFLTASSLEPLALTNSSVNSSAFLTACLGKASRFLAICSVNSVILALSAAIDGSTAFTAAESAT